MLLEAHKQKGNSMLFSSKRGWHIGWPYSTRKSAAIHISGLVIMSILFAVFEMWIPAVGIAGFALLIALLLVLIDISIILKEKIYS